MKTKSNEEKNSLLKSSGWQDQIYLKDSHCLHQGRQINSHWRDGRTRVDEEAV